MNLYIIKFYVLYKYLTISFKIIIWIHYIVWLFGKTFYMSIEQNYWKLHIVGIGTGIGKVLITNLKKKSTSSNWIIFLFDKIIN